MRQYLTGFIQQEGIAFTTELHIENLLNDFGQKDVSSDHPAFTTLHRRSKRNHQSRWIDAHVGGSHDRFFGFHRSLVPGTNRRVIACRRWICREVRKSFVRRSQISTEEIATLTDHFETGFQICTVTQCNRQAFHHRGVHLYPVGEDCVIACCDATYFIIQIAFDLGLQTNITSECQNDDADCNQTCNCNSQPGLQ